MVIGMKSAEYPYGLPWGYLPVPSRWGRFQEIFYYQFNIKIGVMERMAVPILCKGLHMEWMSKIVGFSLS